MFLANIKEQYVNEVNEAKSARDEINVKIAKNEASIQRAKKAIEKLNKKQYNLDTPNWIDSLVRPLAKEISKELGKDYEIYGPFGLRSQTSIHWRDDMTKPITVQPTLSLRLVPGDLKKAELKYETGKKKGEFQKNTIGDVNGFNRETSPLPDSLDEIIQIVLESEEEPEGAL